MDGIQAIYGEAKSGNPEITIEARSPISKNLPSVLSYKISKGFSMTNGLSLIVEWNDKSVPKDSKEQKDT